MKVKRIRASRCPSCGENISIGDHPQIGQYLLCPICDEKVEIINLNPIVLDWMYLPEDNSYNYDEYEDWDRYLGENHS